jgi:hypothetical protein
MCWKFERRGSYFETPKDKMIQSATDYMDCINQNWPEWRKISEQQWDPQEQVPWFRGVHNEDYKLIPSIYRDEDDQDWHYSPEDAEDMKAEFARRAVPFLKQHQHFRKGEYLHLMQHYRCPTRLLDWTEGALLALYFAIRISKEKKKGEKEESHKPCVWMLNPSWLNYENDVINDVEGKSPETNKYKSLVRYTDYWAMEKYHEDRIVLDRYLCREEDLTAKYPIAVFPPHIDVRIVAQKSVFTIHGQERDGFGILAHRDPYPQLAKILITSSEDEIEQIREELEILGITETTLFPDLEGLSREIQAEYKMKFRYP